MAFRRLFPRNWSRRQSPQQPVRPLAPHRTDGRLSRACHHAVEALETRQLLATFFGGDTFQFRDDALQVIRVQFRGNITAELIGAELNRQTNDVTLINLPGVLTRGGTIIPIGGGLEPEGAVQPIGPGGPFTDPLDPGTPVNPNINALAAQADGDTFAIATRPNPNNPAQTQFLVIELTLPGGSGAGPVSGTVVATLTGLAGTQVAAADFDPGSGNLVFVTNNGLGNALGADTFYAVNVDAANPAATLQVIGQIGDAGQTAIITTGLTFTGPGQYTSVVNESQGTGGGGTGQIQLGNSSLVNGTLGNPNVSGLIPINVIQVGQGGGGGPGNASPATGVVSIEFNPNNNTFVGVGFGQTNDVFQIQPGGQAVSLGALVAPAPPQGQIATGQSTVALTFNPGVQDPFSLTQGAFIAYDSATQQFFFVDIRDRNAARTIWAFYISQADASSSITVGWLRNIRDPATPINNIQKPFNGDIGTIRVNPAQGGGPIVITPDAGTGRVYMGARTVDVLPLTSDEELRPVTQPEPVPANTNFGVLPESFTTLAPGLYSAAGTTIGKFLFGGTVTGRVDLGGSINQFYAGWLLTGNANGIPDDAGIPAALQENFRVAGDIRQLLVKDSIGGDDDPAGNEPNYISGFDMKVGGRLGQLNTEDALIGSVEVQNLEDAPRLTTNQREIEFRANDENVQRPYFDGVPDPLETFLGGGPEPTPIGTNLQPFVAGPAVDPRTGQPSFYNDTFETAEYLGSIFASDIGRDDVVRVEGAYQGAPPFNDIADYYGVSLLAGQTVDVRLEQLFAGGVITTTGLLNVGVFDPDGRLIATDYNRTNPAVTTGQVFRFTADRPGVYRFAISTSGDTTFNGSVQLLDIVPYRLTILNVGDIALGAAFANTGILDLADFVADDPAFHVLRGDLGAIESGAGGFLSNIGNNRMIAVEAGNLRAIEAGTIGVIDTGSVQNIVTFDVPAGDVGLIRADGASLAVSNTLDPARTGFFRAIGRDFQLVDAPAGVAYATLVANRAIGVVRANSMATLTPSVFEVNADDLGRDGTIDLIDVTGDLGTLGAGGPQITTNEGGNVRYIRALGNIYRDIFFGGGDPETTNIRPNEQQTITDDSGANVRLRATGPVTLNPAFDPNNPQGTPEFLGTDLEITSYGVRGSGGSVIVNITADSTASAGGGGLEIFSTSGAPAEIGRIEIVGTGAEVIYDVPRDPFGVPLPRRRRGSADRILAFGTTGFGGAAAVPLELRVNGSGPVDILNVVVTAPSLQDLSNATVIANETVGGEIANVTARSVGELVSKGTIGLLKSNTPTAVEGLFDLTMGNSLRDGIIGPDGGTTINNRLIRQVYTDDTVQFGTAASTIGLPDKQFLNRTRNGIVIVGGNITSVRADRGVGNVFVNGSIGEVRANAGGEDVPGVFEGINAPIVTFAFTAVDRADQVGRILKVDVGEGMLPNGSGDYSRAGIFAYGTIGPVTGDRGAVIRGAIHSRNYIADAGALGESPNPAPPIPQLGGVGIEKISLTDGVISNAVVLVSAERGDVTVQSGVITLIGSGDPVNNPVYDIGGVSIDGNGGIIGSLFGAADIGKISVAPTGFGLFSSFFTTPGPGRALGFEIGGYGIRNTFMNTGTSLSNLVATGNGASLPVTGFSPTVRFSEQAGGATPLNPFFDPFFGTVPTVLTDLHVYLGTSSAQPEIAGRTDTGVIEATSALGSRDLGNVRAYQIRGATFPSVLGGLPVLVPTIFNYANSIGTIVTDNIIDGLQVTTGRFKSFAPRSDVFNLDMTVAGPIKKLTINGDLAGNSVVRTSGDAGDMGKIQINGDLTGKVESSQKIKSLRVGGDFTGTVSAESDSKAAVGSVMVNGAFVGSSLLVKGSAGKIVVNGNLGNFGDTLTINGDVKQLQVNGDLRASVIVDGAIGKMTVAGSILSGGTSPGLRIESRGGRFDSLTVGGNIEQGVVITPPPSKLTVRGQNAGTII